MTEKQEMIARLCSQILDVEEPNSGTKMDALSMAIQSLQQSAAFIWRAANSDVFSAREIGGVLHYARIGPNGQTEWHPVKETP